MANLNLTSTWATNVTSIAVADNVVGAGGDPNTGVANVPHVEMGKRTEWLRAQHTILEGTVSGNTAQISTNIADIASLDSLKFDKAGGTITGPVNSSGQVWTFSGGAGPVHTGAGDILHTGSGNIEHSGAGNIEHSGTGDIKQSGTGDIVISGIGKIDVNGGGNIELSGGGAFTGDGSGLDSMTFDTHRQVDLLSGGTVDAGGAMIGSATKPNLFYLSAVGEKDICVEWQYDETTSSYAYHTRYLIPWDYAAGSGSIYIVARFVDNGGSLSAATIGGSFDNRTTAFGFATGAGDVTLGGGGVSLTSSFSMIQMVASGNDFVPGQQGNFVFNVASVTGGGGTDVIQLLYLYFVYNSIHS